MQVIYNKYDVKLVKTLNKLVKEVKGKIKCYKKSSNKNIVRQYIS